MRWMLKWLSPVAVEQAVTRLGKSIPGDDDIFVSGKSRRVIHPISSIDWATYILDDHWIVGEVD